MDLDQDISQLEAVNGVPVTVKDEAVAAVKEELVVKSSDGRGVAFPLRYGLNSSVGRRTSV